MARPTIITLSGKPGSGKSSTADKVAELLGYTRYSSGNLVRKVAKKHGLSLAEFNKKAAMDHSFDDEIDEELRKLRDEREIVIDSRLGFYWIPESFKVYLELDLEVSAARIFKDRISNASRSVEEDGDSTIASVQKDVRERVANERKRYQKAYGVDPYDLEHFDLVIDTSRHSPQTVALTVFDHYRKWLQTDGWEQVRESVPLGYSYKNQY